MVKKLTQSFNQSKESHKVVKQKKKKKKKRKKKKKKNSRKKEQNLTDTS